MRRASRRPGLLAGLLFAGAALAALGYGARLLSNTRPEGGSTLVILAPREGAVLRDSLVIRFRTPAPLRLSPHGWAADDLHPHAILGETEYMAAANDIRPLGDDEYAWRLPAPPTGAHTLRLGWAGPDHRPRGTGDARVRFRFE